MLLRVFSKSSRAQNSSKPFRKIQEASSNRKSFHYSFISREFSNNLPLKVRGSTRSCPLHLGCTNNKLGKSLLLYQNIKYYITQVDKVIEEEGEWLIHVDREDGARIIKVNGNIDVDPPALEGGRRPPYAISFLPRGKRQKIPLQAIVGWMRKAPEIDKRTHQANILPDDFIENTLFAPFLQSVIRSSCYDSPTIKQIAKDTISGWMHIMDLRTPFASRFPTEDIFGTVYLEKGHIVPNSYQIMPSYRIMTALGIPKLDDYVHQRLLEELNKFDVQ